MAEYSLAFDSIWYLLLLGFVPVVWWLGYRSLAGLGRFRRLVVLSFRTVVLTLLVLALAGIQLRRTSERLTVIYLLDQSRSIPVDHRKQMIDYVNKAIAQHRNDEDRAGVIVFGRDAAIEIPPFDDDVQLTGSIESLLDPDYTSLEAAMKLAQASFPEDSAKRIVVISDGNENLGDSREQARGLAESGIGVDVVPIRYSARAEVLVEKVAIASEVRRGQPFDLRVVVNNTTQPTQTDAGHVSGELIISQQTDDQPVVLSQERITLAPGKHVFTLRQQIDQPHFYTYEAHFVPDRPEDDAMPQNNRATMFTHVRGRGQVLLIENAETRGEHDFLVERLRARNLEVTVRSSDQLFTSLPELQQFDTVLLADVPREAFSDQQIQMLVSNTEYMGAGLVMLGGPNSFGAGGWANTELEKAMPVDFQIKSARVVPKGALALVFHASELPQGNYWQKVIGEEAIKALGNQDYCGVLHWNGNERWLWNHPVGMWPVGRYRDRMLADLDKMTPGDMPDFDPTMVMARKGFARIKDAAIKHMIIISDGDPSPASGSALKGLQAGKVTVSTVAVGTHGPAGSSELKRIARVTGGKYYAVRNNKVLPRIFQREARRVARPLVYENPLGVQPQLVRSIDDEMMSGFDGPPPPITGFVLTQLKRNPLVSVALVSPKPAAVENNTVLASWTYGVGKAVAYTSDSGTRWSKAWTGWEGYDKLFSQIVLWSMRPVGDQGKFTLVTDVQDEKVNVVVTAMDQDDQFLNFLEMGATAVGPDMQPKPFKMEQTAPGRYVGSFDSKDAGSYFVMLSPGAGQAPLRAGINVPYSAEFRSKSANEPLLAQLAAQRPVGGKPGELIDDPLLFANVDGLLTINSFRHDLKKAMSSQDAWYYLVMLATVLFFADVFFRRVTVDLAWVGPMVGRVRDRLLQRETPPPMPEFMERLRSRKAEVAEHLEQRRAAARFEPTREPEPGAAASAVADVTPTPPKPGANTPGERTDLTPEKEEDTYTSRLLKAKKKVWEERQDG